MSHHFNEHDEIEVHYFLISLIKNIAGLLVIISAFWFLIWQATQ